MNSIKIIYSSIFVAVVLLLAAVPAYAESCDPGAGALPIPTWYAYIPGEVVNGSCELKTENLGGKLAILIMMGVFDIVLFLAGIFAVIMVIFGGYKLLVSNGEPQKIAAGRTTIINSLVGLVIAVIASQVVGFIARSLT